MLLRFGCSNHLSIRSYQEVSLVASNNALGRSLPLAPNTRLHVVPVVGIYGANASGKSNVLNSLLFMKRMVLESHARLRPSDPVPNSTFGLDKNAQSEDSVFECEFVSDSTRFVYGFTVRDNQFTKEFLYAYPKGHKQVWFSRDEENPGSRFEFGKFLRGRNSTIADLTRKNSLFLSAAAQQNHEQLSQAYAFFHKKLRQESQMNDGLLAEQASSHKEWLIEFLRTADFGVQDIQIEQVPLEEKMQKMLSALFAEFESDAGSPEEDKKPRFELPQSMTEVRLGHKGSGGEVSFFPWELESSGTKRLFRLLIQMLYAIDNGGVAVIDEVDTSLHTLLASRVVDLFRNKSFNRKNAQLVFSTHDTNLLCRLNHDEIWFTEKDNLGRTNLYALSDFKLRKTDRVEKGYLQGRFGAIPFFGSTEELFQDG